MSDRSLPLESDALRANIADTAQDVQIPEPYLPLLEAVLDLPGVHEPLMETLEEYFHGFRNVEAVIDGLQTVLLRNWSYFERSAERTANFERLAELALGLFQADLTPDQASRLTRLLLTWLLQAVDGPHGDAYLSCLADSFDRISGLLLTRPLALLERAGLLRDLLGELETRPASRDSIRSWRGMLRTVLKLGYERVAAHMDVASWAASGEEPLNDPRAIQDLFAALDGSRMRELQAAVETAFVSWDPPDEADSGRSGRAGTHDPLLELPILADHIDVAVGTVFKLPDIEDRFSVCLFFLRDDTLGYRQHEVMVDLLAVVKGMMQPARRTDFDRLLDRLTRFFHKREGLYPEMRFQCYEAIGVAIGTAGATRAADHITNDLLSWHFQYPELSGATDEWQTIVNPFHLPNIRCWMRIIESNPTLYERLTAALNVQLQLGGVFIADTDLFQRDVTRFLNADIGPIYFVAKQLLRSFPVFFNEVGAEGELRSVSTEIDEVCGRRDTLMHFLRKQAHAESSNRLVDFSSAVLEYWRTLDPTALEPFLSADTMSQVRREKAWAEGPHRVMAASGEGPDESAETGQGHHPGIAEDEGGCGGVHDVRRVALMRRFNELLAEKYSPTTGDLAARIEGHLSLSTGVRRRFGQAVLAWDEAGAGAADDYQARRDELLDACLEVLEQLKKAILSPLPTEATESIYHKRHIAAGIPSMYGTYAEPKFDAVGLTLRVERLAGRLLEEAADEYAPRFLTRASLRDMAGTIKRFARALDTDGAHSQSLNSNHRLLEASTERTTFAFEQYENVFRFLAQSVSDLARLSVLSHDQALRTILEADPRQCERRGLPADALAEIVLRDVLVSAFGLQTLDRYVGSGLQRLTALRGQLAEDDLTRMMNYDPERLVTFIHEPDPALDDQITLGYKALGLKHLAEYGHRVPQGFILTTELYAATPAMSYRPLYDDTISRLRRAVDKLESITGFRLGDPARPLTLSIRSGAAVSLPGVLPTFINVGLNETITEALAEREGFAWTAWDSYRRFLQSWAMSAGVERDVFDALMAAHKARFGVTHKVELAPEQMREVALAYKAEARALGTVLLDDPFRQLVGCVRSVITSWDSDQAHLYRRHLGVSEQWGTAVIVQHMVLGNRSQDAGAGVTFTRDPNAAYSRQVRLFGDFAICSQGEDLVGGLIFPLPISEAQRRSGPAYRGVESSLESSFPQIYEALLQVAEDLVVNRGYDPQELEFTFESPDADDLYMLQKRPMVQNVLEEVPVFDQGDRSSCELPITVGMGVAGGAYAGRVAVTAVQIDELAARDPDDPILLLRPDTVPEDLALIVRAQGLLTARGGATSHAAVTAKRLGKTAVVDCRALEVDEARGLARLAGYRLNPGDWLSIDGVTGRIFLGRLDIIKPKMREPRKQ